MHLEILDYLRGVNMSSILLRLTLATVFGGIIGLQRGKKNRAAGFKTHMLVCIGATLAMLTNQYLILANGGIGDPSRLGAQVISGIGFLGAGTILVTGKQQVKGLTTAAGLWACACMGLAIGVGFYEGAVISCLFIFAVMTIFNKVDAYFMGKSKLVDIYVELKSINDFKPLLDYLRDNNLRIVYMESTHPDHGAPNAFGCFISIDQKEHKDHDALVSLINHFEGVDFVEEL